MRHLLSICLLFVMVDVGQAKIPASDFFIPVPEINSNDGVGIISELLSRLQDKGYITGEKPVGAGHYAAHKMNNELREKYRCSASYIPGGWSFVAPHPTNFTLQEVIDLTELTLPGNGIPVRDWNDQPFYLLDELSAYVCGTMAGIEAGLTDTTRVRWSYKNARILLHYVRVMIDLAEVRGYPHIGELEALYMIYHKEVNMLYTYVKGSP